MAGVSRVFVSPPLGCPGNQPHYRNAAAKLQTLSPPRRIFSALRGIEARMQKRFRRRNAPRVLDADYLSHGAAILRGRSLRLPHPRMSARAFVPGAAFGTGGAGFFRHAQRRRPGARAAGTLRGAGNSSGVRAMRDSLLAMESGGPRFSAALARGEDVFFSRWRFGFAGAFAHRPADGAGAAGAGGNCFKKLRRICVRRGGRGAFPACECPALSRSASRTRPARGWFRFRRWRRWRR